MKAIKFSDLDFEKKFDGVQAIVKLENGYEVSVIKNGLSHGSDKGLYEIGVFVGYSDSQNQTIPLHPPVGSDKMCDPLGWGDDVKGWLSPDGVEKEIALIQAL
jgi:hypothetical protein